MTILPSASPQHVAGSAVPILYGPGVVGAIGKHVKTFGTRVLLVSDPGLIKIGHTDRVAKLLMDAGCDVASFANIGENPTTDHVDDGVNAAQMFKPEVIVGLGGGSAMDVAKGINFVYTNGGTMKDYWGVGKATKPMLPCVLIPTTAGTGSEAQSAALISNAATHAKMACLDKKAMAKLAILDPELAVTAPLSVIANTGIDALSHAVESAGCTKRTDLSQSLSKAAWERLVPALGRTLVSPNIEDMGSLLVGAYLAGAAIENAMLGGAHALANPLTATFNVVHGVAVGVMLPWVVQFNTAMANPYQVLGPPTDVIATILTLRSAAGCERSLKELGVPFDAIPALSEAAAKQWTATFNPRPISVDDMRQLYTQAWQQSR